MTSLEGLTQPEVDSWAPRSYHPANVTDGGSIRRGTWMTMERGNSLSPNDYTRGDLHSARSHCTDKTGEAAGLEDCTVPFRDLSMEFSQFSSLLYPFDVIDDWLLGRVNVRRFCAYDGHPPAFFLQRVVPLGDTQLMI